jgi:O-acetyl-ADP-ribose deacetylase
MERRVGNTRLTTVTGDLTRSPDLDLIVNAANEQLRAGGGVCGVIFRAAGHEAMQAACKGHMRNADGLRCPVGQARSTPAFGLPNRGVVHAVGPIYSDKNPALMREQLASAHQSALSEAARHGFGSIGFPAISCGIYGYPANDAARVATTALRDWLQEHPDSSLREVRLVFLAMGDGPMLQGAFEAALSALGT